MRKDGLSLNVNDTNTRCPPRIKRTRTGFVTELPHIDPRGLHLQTRKVAWCGHPVDSTVSKKLGIGHQINKRDVDWRASTSRLQSDANLLIGFVLCHSKAMTGITPLANPITAC